MIFKDKIQILEFFLITFNMLMRFMLLLLPKP